MSTSSRPKLRDAAVEKVACLRCKAPAGARCVDVSMRPTRRGRVLMRPHESRMAAARKAGYR